MRVALLLIAMALACQAVTATPSPSPRLVSLAPSLTEIVYAIGCGSQLVADTSYDDYPSAARRLPHVADLIQVDLERLAVLHPTRVLALHDQEREGAPITAQLSVPVVYLPNRSLPDLFADITAVGHACHAERAAQALTASLRQRLTQIAGRAHRYPAHPKVLYLLDLPGFTAGKQSFLDDLIRLAGGTNVAAAIPQPYPNVNGEWLLRVQPDVIIVSKATPFGPDVRATEPWRSLRAVQTNRVYRPPNDDILQRDGPRIADGLAWLVAVIHGK